MGICQFPHPSVCMKSNRLPVRPFFFSLIFSVRTSEKCQTPSPQIPLQPASISQRHCVLHALYQLPSLLEFRGQF